MTDKLLNETIYIKPNVKHTCTFLYILDMYSNFSAAVTGNMFILLVHYFFFQKGILALSNQAIEGEAYSWIAVVVLPVNAAVNPVLYTLSALINKKVNSDSVYTNNNVYQRGTLNPIIQVLLS